MAPSGDDDRSALAAMPLLLPVEEMTPVLNTASIRGRIERGTIRAGEEIELVGLLPTRRLVPGEIRANTGTWGNVITVQSAQVGDYVDVMLPGLGRYDVFVGQVLCKPGSIQPYSNFRAEVSLLSKEEGGRHTPIFSDYRVGVYFRTAELQGVMRMPQGVEMISPGETVAVSIELMGTFAMEPGSKFGLREGGRTLAFGTVTAGVA